MHKIHHFTLSRGIYQNIFDVFTLASPITLDVFFASSSVSWAKVTERYQFWSRNKNGSHPSICQTVKNVRQQRGRVAEIKMETPMKTMKATNNRSLFKLIFGWIKQVYHDRKCICKNTTLENQTFSYLDWYFSQNTPRAPCHDMSVQYIYTCMPKVVSFPLSARASSYFITKINNLPSKREF